MNEQQLQALRQSAGALILFGGRHCGVCHAIAPRLQALLKDEFPKLQYGWVDCQGEGASLCAQAQVFALPVVQIWFEGKEFARFARVFALADVREAIARPYALVFGGSGAESGDAQAGG